MSLSLDDHYLKILDSMENSPEHIFLTGNAGTGKTTLLDYFRTNTKKNLAVVAPTGVAAVNARGETIHSFFGFAPSITIERAREEGAGTKKGKIYKALEVLIIDEISMVRADLLDCIDNFLRIARRKDLPFGGVRLIMVGDLFQLPPVVTNDEKQAIESMYETPFFFSSNVFRSLFEGLYKQLRFLELTTIYRQSEQKFVGLLNRIRNKEATEEDINSLNMQVISESDCLDNFIILTSINEQANRINQAKLDQIDGPTYTFRSTRQGNFAPQYAPADDTIFLKTGARVMLLNNDTQDRWINGTIGTLYRVEGGVAYVKIDNGDVEKVEPFTWKSFKTVFNQDKKALETEEVGSFKQLPLKLAWAITIHKSQGKTFDKVAIDFGRGAFAHGQTYVALSRCTNFSGIKLLRPITGDSIIMDNRVVTFLENLRQSVG